MGNQNWKQFVVRNLYKHGDLQGKCPVPRPWREGIRPNLLFEIEEFRKVIRDRKNKVREEEKAYEIY